ncbi:tetratricopeptide repeat protein [Micromonospora sp. LOL_028]
MSGSWTLLPVALRAQLQSLLGDVYLARHDFATAEKTFLEVLSAVRVHGDRVGETYALYRLGIAAATQGSRQSAEHHLAEAQAQATHLGDGMLTGQIQLSLGEVYLEGDRCQSALDLLKQCRRRNE